VLRRPVEFTTQSGHLVIDARRMLLRHIPANIASWSRQSFAQLTNVKAVSNNLK
jgi:hypothetical protein